MKQEKRWASLTMRATPAEMNLLDKVRMGMQKNSINIITRTDIVREAIRTYCTDWQDETDDDQVDP